jgi:capsid protein
MKPVVRVKAGSAVPAAPVRPVGQPSQPKARSSYMRDTQSGIIAKRPASLREHRDEVRRIWTRAAGLAMDLLQNSGKLRGAADQIIADTVGVELQLSPKPDLSRFGYSPEEATAWVRQLKADWKIYSWNPLECDFRAKWTIPQMTDIGVRHWLAFGESVGMCNYLPASQRLPGTMMGTKTLLLSPQQLVQDTNDVEGLYQGIIHDAYGRPVAYRFEQKRDGMKYKTDYAARDADGRQMVFHAFDPFSSEDVRGISVLTPVFRKWLMGENVDDATAELAFLQTIYSATLTSDRPSAEAFEAFEAMAGASDHGKDLVGDLVDYYQAQFDRAAESEIKLGVGAGVSHLAPGEKLDFKNVTTPGPNHKDFIGAINREAARALGITYGGYTLDFTDATYSSTQMENAALWPIARRRTDRIASPHVLVPYGRWLDERIETGMTQFKGGVEAYNANREAVLWALCVGPSKPTADDLKKAKGQSERILNGVGTLEQEISEDGGDPEEVFENRLYWHQRYLDAGMRSPFERGLPSDPSDNSNQNERERAPRREDA